MRNRRTIFKVVTFFLIVSLSACGKATPQNEFEDFKAGNFKDSANIDNEWLPLQPGTKLVYEGLTDDNGELVPHRLIITVTDLTKVINGVRSVITWDLDYSSGELVEAELAFFSQDNNGAVWRMGEHPEDYADGKFSGASTWISGIEDSVAGIEMQAGPKLGMASYSEGWAPAVEFSDRAQISKTGQKVCIPVDCYENVLVVDETSKAEPDAHQFKYFAAGIGNIKVDWAGADQTQETLELVEVIQLSSDELAQVREEALKLEKHAYEVSDVYQRTSPAEYPAGTPAITIDIAEAPQASVPQDISPEVIVYASDLTDSALFELDFMDDPASPGNKMIGLPNNGDELDPPPENDPHVIFNAQVHSGIPYRCWIHMKVGAPKGKSQANTIWAQFSGAVDKANKGAFKPGSSSYLTAQGPAKEGWAWVGCDSTTAESLVYFQSGGEITVRLQAGAEGVGFDQFILSSAEFLEDPPAETIVEK